jgi:alanine-glyoxylate transaminase/serine-glyoxylate transaminase/serine-pyruvate transaminase
VQATARRVVHDGKQIAADPVHLRLDDAHDRVGGNRRVDRVAAALEDLHAGASRQRLARSHDPIGGRYLRTAGNNSHVVNIHSSARRTVKSVATKSTKARGKPALSSCLRDFVVALGRVSPGETRMAAFDIVRARGAQMRVTRGRHFLQIPGPTNVPDRVLRALSQPTIDHRGPAFARLGREVLDGLQQIVQTSGPVVTYPSSGTGAWEAALVNTLSPGDRVLMFETGHFATLWRNMAVQLGLEVDFVPGDWRSGVGLDDLSEKLAADPTHALKAVAVVHNETSTGATSRIAEIRQRMNRAHHPALLLVDTISSLGCTDFRHDDWEVDVTVSCSQKGLMLPPGLGFNAISAKALAASRSARLPRAYWDWQPMIDDNRAGFFPYTPATNLLYGLREAIAMLLEEGLPNVFARHARHGEATRQAVRAWGLDILCLNPEEYSNSLTAVMMPDGHDADRLRETILERFDMSLGTGLGRLKGRVFRIGHLGDLNDLMLAGTLSGVEMGLAAAGVPFRSGGVTAALECLAGAVSVSGSKS